MARARIVDPPGWQAWSFADLDAGAGLEELDISALPALELEVLTELGYCLLHAPTAPPTAALGERN